MSAAAGSTLGNFDAAGRERPPRRHLLLRTGSSASRNNDYFPPGFYADQTHITVPPKMRVEQPARSINRRGKGPFVGAGHPVGWLPRQVDDSLRQSMQDDDAVASEDMFYFFLQRFSRPVSATSLPSQRRQRSAALAGAGAGGVRGPGKTGGAGRARASGAMASSVRAAQRSRDSTAARAARSRSLPPAAQLLGPQYSAPELGQAVSSCATDAIAALVQEEAVGTSATAMVRSTALSPSSDSDGDVRRGTNEAPSGTMSPRSLRLKILGIEQFQRKQDTAMAEIRRENLRLKRQAVEHRTTRSSLENEVARLSQRVVILTEAQLNKEVEIKLAVDAATGNGRGRNGLGAGKSDAEFARLKEMYATTEEVKKMKRPLGAGYSPWDDGVVSTFEARDSMAEVLGSMKDFLTTVESEQFVNRQVREEAYHFAHSLDLHKLRDDVPSFETQCPDGSWKELPPATNKILVAAREAAAAAGGRTVASAAATASGNGLSVVVAEHVKADGRKVSYSYHLQTRWAKREGMRTLRARARSQLERVAGILSTVMGIQVLVPSNEPAAACVQDGSVESVFTAITDRLETGHVPSLGCVFQFVVFTGPDAHQKDPSKTPYELVALDMSKPPGKVVHGELTSPTQTFQVTLPELVSLTEQLAKPNQVNATIGTNQPAMQETLADAKPGKKRPKKKGGKKPGVDTGHSMIWEECLESGVWRVLPEVRVVASVYHALCYGSYRG
eukprot:COSAG01_NODE_1221_length_11155_cov_13.069736_5_plen_729_part_00